MTEVKGSFRNFELPVDYLTDSDQAMFDLLSCHLDTGGGALIASLHGPDLPNHCRVPAVVFKKTEDGLQETLSIHIRHLPLEEIGQEVLSPEIARIGTPDEIIPDALESRPGSTKDSVENVGTHAKTFLFTGEIMLNCSNLTVKRLAGGGLWQVSGQYLNTWESPQKAMELIRSTAQNNNNFQWRVLPLAK